MLARAGGGEARAPAPSPSAPADCGAPAQLVLPPAGGRRVPLRIAARASARGTHAAPRPGSRTATPYAPSLRWKFATGAAGGRSGRRQGAARRVWMSLQRRKRPESGLARGLERAEPVQTVTHELDVSGRARVHPAPRMRREPRDVAGRGAALEGPASAQRGSGVARAAAASARSQCAVRGRIAAPRTAGRDRQARGHARDLPPMSLC